MRIVLLLSIIALSVGFFFTPDSEAGFAQPPLWETEFGEELAELTNQDDAQQMVELPFPFPFKGNTYSTAYVGTNGCIQLDGLGLDGEIDYDYFRHMEDFLSDSDPDNPIICPFETDLDLDDDAGMIFYNDTADPLVFTWYEVGSIQDEDEISTFQILLYSDGSIAFSYNGLAIKEDPDSFDNGIVVGITPSDLFYNEQNLIIPTDPGPNDLNGPRTFYDRATIYERWCYTSANSCGVGSQDTGLPGPTNNFFDLDFQSICFDPQGGGFEVSSAGAENPNFICGQLVATQIPTLSEWGLIAMAGLIGIAGLIFHRRKVSA